jgi:RNA polymerase sigma factor (sigma-70 family)
LTIPVDNVTKLTDNLFRAESKKMVAVLTKIFGTENLQTAEDVVQETLIIALNTWKLKGIPDNPSAWLYRAAKNKAIDIIRRNKHSLQYDFSSGEKKLLTSAYTVVPAMNDLWKEELIVDDLLGMMFACCHPQLSTENQITLILKTLCSFSTSEIAKAFLTPEDTISKRLYRTKEFFRQNKIELKIPSPAEIKSRTNTVLNAVYLLFNEGYNSASADTLIRKDVMDEAIILCKLLTENAHTQQPEVFALMALMCFHAARIDSRLSVQGEIILLAMQDRRKWNRQLIDEGNVYMNKAAFGDEISTYHLEAAIAFEHCAAESFEQTNWKKILNYYDWLCTIAPSPVTELNKAVVVLQIEGAAVALQLLNNINDRKKLENWYLYYAVLGEIYLALNNKEFAKTNFETAVKLTQSEAEKRMLKNRIRMLFN